MEEPEEPRGASVLWLRLRKTAPVSTISGAPTLEPLEKTPFERAPSEAGAGAVDEALPKGLLVSDSHHRRTAVNGVHPGTKHRLGRLLVKLGPEPWMKPSQRGSYSHHRQTAVNGVHPGTC
jgi:hypothetical protein